MSRPAVMLPTAQLDPRFGDKSEYTNAFHQKLSIASCTVQNSSVPSTAPLRKDQQIQMNTNEIQRDSMSLNDC